VKKQKRLSLILTLLMITATFSAFLCLPSVSAAAATRTVTTAADTVSASDGQTSLREAVSAAASGDTIRFDLPASKASGGKWIIKLKSTIRFSKALTIDGRGKIILDGQKASRIFWSAGEKKKLTLKRLTLQNGKDLSGDGGGIYAEGAVTAIDCIFSGNTTGYSGGGLFADGAVTLTNCTFSGNSAVLGGGGAYAIGAVAATGCTFSNNKAIEKNEMEQEGYGGGLGASGAITAANCSFSGNTAGANGGGIYTGSPACVYTACTFSGNTATYGGGIYVSGAANTFTDCTISGNTALRGSGGGIYTLSAVTATGCTLKNNKTTIGSGGGIFGEKTVTLKDCIVNNNAADGAGGGLEALSTVTATSSTFSGNTALLGSGIYGENAVTAVNSVFTKNNISARDSINGTIEGKAIRLYHCTVAQNTGAGVYGKASPHRLRNCIMVGNTVQSDNLSSTGSNLIEGEEGVTYAAIFGTNAVEADGLLKPKKDGLADKTATALKKSAITGDGVSETTATGIMTALKTDRVGASRPASGAVTYGALEVTVPISKLTISGVSRDMIKGKTAILKAMVTPTEGTNKAMTWSSSNTKIASVNQSGKVTANFPGTVTIKATARDGSKKSASVTINVHQYVTMRIGKTTAIQNGKATTIDSAGTKPFKISGKTMVPLRFVGEKMGGTVEYISAAEPIRMSYGDTTVEFKLNSKNMKIIKENASTTVLLEVSAQLVQGKTYIPLRAVSQALGFDVYYEAGTEYIVVNNPKMSVSVKTARLAEAKSVIK